MNSLPELIRLTGLKLHGFVANGTDWIGHIGLQAQMTLWLIRFVQETDAPNGYGGRMCERSPKPNTETWPCTFAIAQFGWVYKIRFPLTINSRRIILAVSPESCCAFSAEGSAPKQRLVNSRPGPLIPWHRRSPMTRKDTRNTSALRGIAPLIAVLTVMIALAALAQTKGAGPASGK